VIFYIHPLATNSYWQFGDGVSSTGNTVLHHYTNEETFSVVTIIDQGSICADTITTKLDLTNVSLINDLYIPNCFTPNGDLKNDFFIISGNGCSEIKMKIFNRWGNLIYETTDLENGWNGKVDNIDCPEGIYLLLLQNETIKRSGFITLIR
jgi:gliding motility-associated-like protein